MSKNKDRWSALSMKERAELFKIGIQNGITDRNTIIKMYNSYSNGGRILDGKTEENQTLSNEPVYYDNTPIETPVVKAFNSNEEYNRYYGEQFGRKVAKQRDEIANQIVSGLELVPVIGDGLDIANITANLDSGDYKKAILGMGLMLLPNALEEGARQTNRVLTHAFDSMYLPTMLSDKFGKATINPSMAVSTKDRVFNNHYGDIVLVGDNSLLEDSFLYRGDGDTSAVGLFTDSYDEVRDVHKVSSQMRTIDSNSTVPQLSKEKFLGLEPHPEYHEVKRNRITGLNEFNHALVPEVFKTNTEWLSYLDEMGIPYSFYSEGAKQQAILNYISEHPEVLFKNGGKLLTKKKKH